ncbi:MAG: imidazole glycerol phosphate synthase subunit HisH, partial [Anaerolineae bacterium]
MHVTLLDAGSGNLRSVHKALEHLGAQVTRTSDPALARQAEALVLPGVGAFGAFMDGLRARGLDAVVRDAVRQGIPTLGICVGMQALFERGFEMGEHAGLGLLPGEVVR